MRLRTSRSLCHFRWRVLDAFQKQARGWRGPRRDIHLRARLPLDRPQEIFRAQLAQSDLYQHADNPPNHAPKKMRRADPEQNEVPFHLNPRGLYNHHGRNVRPGRIERAEGGKVVTANQHGSGARHRRHVQLFFHPPHVLLHKRGAARRDLIEVRPADGVVPRMELRRRRLHFDYAHVGGQPVVEPAANLLRTHRPRGFDAQMRHLRQRMYSRVRAPGALDIDLGLEQLLGRRPKLPHYRAGVDLLLPAAVLGAIVFERETQNRDLAHVLWGRLVICGRLLIGLRKRAARMGTQRARVRTLSVKVYRSCVPWAPGMMARFPACGRLSVGPGFLISTGRRYVGPSGLHQSVAIAFRRRPTGFLISTANAVSSNSTCSCWWRLSEPAAGLALSARPR